MLIHSLIADGIEYIDFAISANKDQDGSFGIATGYGLVGPGIKCRWVARFFAPLQNDHRRHQVSCTMGTVSLSRE
jgi:hypothetical protein